MQQSTTISLESGNLPEFFEMEPFRHDVRNLLAKSEPVLEKEGVLDQAFKLEKLMDSLSPWLYFGTDTLQGRHILPAYHARSSMPGAGRASAA